MAGAAFLVPFFLSFVIFLGRVFVVFFFLVVALFPLGGVPFFFVVRLWAVVGGGEGE